MRKSNKKRDQKRSAKARKQLHDKVGAQKQQEQYEAGQMRVHERERERIRRNRMQVNPFAAMYGGRCYASGCNGRTASFYGT